MLCMRRPVRSYPWGVAEALHSTNSDMLALKRLLTELSFEDLKARTEARYYKYRTSRIALAMKWGNLRAKSIGSSPSVATSMPPGARKLGLDIQEGAEWHCCISACQPFAVLQECLVFHAGLPCSSAC